MKILIVGVKNNPQAKRVIEEGVKRGHTVEAVLSSELITSASEGKFEPTLRNNDITSYDLVYLWAVSKRRWDWFATAVYLSEKHNIKVINQKVIDPNYFYFLTPASDYQKQVEHNLPFPKSTITFSKSSLNIALEPFEFPLILKASPGRKGKTVYKINSKKEAEIAIEENKDNANSFILREFIPNDGDIRVFTIGYKAIGAMKRTPPEGDFRSNISQGGSGKPFDLDRNPKVKELAEKVSKLTRTEIAGVDIMLHAETGEPYILEINPGPQFEGLEKFTEVNAAEEIIKYFESVVSESTKK